jgi:hypothetical protein
MGDLSARLSSGVAMLGELDRKRQEHTMTAEDYDREYAVLAVELWDLEEEILLDPGALAPHVSR